MQLQLYRRKPLVQDGIQGHRAGAARVLYDRRRIDLQQIVGMCQPP